jgi:flagellar biosynthetic protein FlhB
MSRDDLREEMKQTEGNPQIKMRIRRLQRQVRRRKMLQDVQRASVVVANPTHFAVALQYGPELAAPVVVAKGRNLLAEQIKQTARWHGISIMENPPLAQALYRSVQIGQAIPAKLYAAVAEILAFVYRMQAQAARAEERGHGR